MTTRPPLVPRISISPETVREAQQTRPRSGARLVLRAADGRDLDLAPSVEDTLIRTLEAIAECGSVSIAQIPDELTSTVAADVLGVSRPTLLTWARAGAIDSFKVGTHTRFRRDDVVKLRDRRECERRNAFAKLRALDADEDLLPHED